jgi:hypothetical protein
MKRTMALLATVLFIACEAPPVFPGADKRQNTLTSRIDGHVIASTKARGNVALFLYDAARPPPPTGTGRPVSFTVLSQDAVFGGASDADRGPFVAPFAFSLVPPGRYLIQGFIDTSADFVPWYTVTAEPNTSDVAGAALDAVTRTRRTIEIGASTNGELQPAVDVPVSFADTSLVPIDRPVFEVAGGVQQITLGSTAKVLELQARAISEGVVHEARPTFLARLVDDNADGIPDDANGDGTPDFWPRIVVRKMAEGAGPVIDENDLDRNGVLETDVFSDYEHVNPSTGATIPADGAPDLVVLAAGFDFTELMPQLLDSQGSVKLEPLPVDRLKLVVQPRAFDASTPGQLRPLKALPSGRYALTVIQSTGQTWRVPNELSGDAAKRASLPDLTSQSFVIQVP